MFGLFDDSPQGVAALYLQSISESTSSPLTPLEIAGSLVLSLALSQAIALCYEWTYEGLSYNRRFVHSLTLSAIVSCTLMLAIGGSLALGLGALGAMSMVRFRTNIRDIWDMSFLFASLTIGLTCGAKQPLAAMISVGLFCGVAFVLIRAGVGTRHRFDGVVRFWRAADQSGPDLDILLQSYCVRASLVSLREGNQGDVFEYSYQIALKKKVERGFFIAQLRTLPGISSVNLFIQDEHLEL